MADDLQKTGQASAAERRHYRLKPGSLNLKVRGGATATNHPPSSDLAEEVSREMIDAERLQFEAKAAELIFRFMGVDELLFKLFRVLLGQDDHLAALLYYNNEYFKARCGLVTKMAGLCVVDDDTYNRWIALSKELKSISDTRNLVAHRPFDVQRVLRVGSSDGPGQMFLGATNALREHVANRNKGPWWAYGNDEEKMRVNLAGLKRVLSRLDATEKGIIGFVAELENNPDRLGRVLRRGQKPKAPKRQTRRRS